MVIIQCSTGAQGNCVAEERWGLSPLPLLRSCRMKGGGGFTRIEVLTRDEGWCAGLLRVSHPTVLQYMMYSTDHTATVRSMGRRVIFYVWCLCACACRFVCSCPSLFLFFPVWHVYFVENTCGAVFCHCLNPGGTACCFFFFFGTHYVLS